MSAVQMPTPSQPKAPAASKEMTPEEIVAVLAGYQKEAEEARKTGMNARDDKWSQNLDLYWGRYDFSGKASWQAKEVMPEVAAHVDRFAAACKEAIMTAPDDFYDVNDPSDKEEDLGSAIKRLLNVWLSTTGRNQNGGILAFPQVFEEQVKLGALMACSSTTMWKWDVPGGRVAVESVDPRQVWLDPTFRNLYRIRRIELDWHDLKGLAKLKDGKGKPLFRIDQIENMVTDRSLELRRVAEERTGMGLGQTARPTVVLDEFIATVCNAEGDVAHEHALFVVANGRYLLRGPEKNPFWHERDWLLFAPLITVPLSVYGRSFMEDFGSIAKTFNDLTNMILDAVYVSGMKCYALVPDLLKDPRQAATGLQPMKTFLLEDGTDPRQFMAEIELGTLSPDVIQVWSAMKNELMEAGKQNEIGLGQFAPKGRTSATEVAETQSSASAFVRSVAQSIEVGWLNPTLDLVWKTGLQHAPRNSPHLEAAAGPEMWQALHSSRRELCRRPVTFQARGISTMIQKSRVMRSLMGLLQLIASNELLLGEFMRVVDMPRLIEVLFELSDIDLYKLQASERTRMIRQIVEQMPQPGAEGAASPEQQQVAGQTAQTIGAL